MPSPTNKGVTGTQQLLTVPFQSNGQKNTGQRGRSTRQPLQQTRLDLSRKSWEESSTTTRSDIPYQVQSKRYGSGTTVSPSSSPTPQPDSYQEKSTYSIGSDRDYPVQPNDLDDEDWSMATINNSRPHESLLSPPISEAEQRSKLLDLAKTETTLDKAEVKKLFDACAKRALDGDVIDRELILGLIYEENFFLIDLAKKEVPTLYARSPDDVAMSLLKLVYEKHRPVEPKKTVFVDAPSVFYLLAYHLRHHYDEMRQLPDLELSNGSKIPMSQVLPLCYNVAYAKKDRFQLSEIMQPKGDPLAKETFLARDRMIQPGELDCARDIGVNFEQKKNVRLSWFQRLMKLFTFTLFRSDYVVREDVGPVRYGGVIKWRYSQDRHEEARFQYKLEFIVHQHLTEWESNKNRDLTTIYDICDVQFGGTGAPRRYVQLVLRNDGAVLVDSAPFEKNSDVLSDRDVVTHLACYVRDAWLEKVEIRQHYLARTQHLDHSPGFVRSEVRRVPQLPNYTLTLKDRPVEVGTNKDPVRLPTEGPDQKNLSGLMGLYLKEQLSKSPPKSDGKPVPLGETVEGIIDRYSRSERKEQDETELRLRMRLAYDVDKEICRPTFPWW